MLAFVYAPQGFKGENNPGRKTANDGPVGQQVCDLLLF